MGVVLLRFLSVLLALIVLINPVSADVHTVVDPHLRPYYQNFVNEAQEHQCNLYPTLIALTFGDDGEFTKVGPNTVGLCFWSLPERVVAIRKSYWDSIGSFQRRVLIYHELGHCLLTRQHDESMFDQQCPSSIMYPVVLENKCTELAPWYFEEIFHTPACQPVACPFKR